MKAVIATNGKVDDAEAARFANYFYRWFFENNATLRKAFDTAAATVTNDSDASNRGLGIRKTSANVYNSTITIVNPGEERHPMSASWTLFVHSRHIKALNWTLHDFVNDFNKPY